MKRAALSLIGLLVGLAVFYLLPKEGREPMEQPAPRPVPQEAPASIPAPSTDEEWSDTEPAINLEHVFEGKINRRGKPVGFHSRPGGKDPSGARVARKVSGPNGLGVYIAEVEIRNGSRWLRKTSTFYPDSMDRDEVVAAILNAWEERRDLGGGKFQGPSGEGFTIEGYTLDDGGINTAYPIYKRSE
ncbi:MAG TPA: EndoU domain-containing protein [Thermoanaerobaculia bacterium]